MATTTSKGLMNLALKAAGSSSINWYPGHMATAMRDIKERVKVVDLIIEVRDARVPISSANIELQEILRRKKHLIVLNKMDLANPNTSNRWSEYFEACKQDHVFVNAHSKESVKNMVRQVRTSLSEAIRKEQTLLTMVVGIPNVGKSVITNSVHRIARYNISVQEKLKKAEVGPLPGVTQQISAFKIGHTPSIYLLDTPGVLVPNISNIETGLKLALTGAFKDSVVGQERLARYLLGLLNSRRSSFHVKWKAEAEAKAFIEDPVAQLKFKKRQHQSDFKTEVRGVIASTLLDFVGNVEDEHDMEVLVDTQMKELRKLFQIPEEAGDTGWTKVSSKLLNLYRIGKLGAYTWDIVPEVAAQ
ncbi:hypothetical protein O6H91_17G062800 [Diphasiastrum complanatum]|uniref:Uncharacterized protein n=1 Tax=Diphasiastrum complanatum TaxID=34168 RepID=A0ACC2B8K5_DIPCM|nr:hypothetical protein O6H91_Y064800 [Diphasiastrum complanatum]KAJ7525714.1 hypothetical protein O6H91_17G062800 [Diphasiastrum complanatum]